MIFSNPLGISGEKTSNLKPNCQSTPGFSNPKISPLSEIIEEKKASDKSLLKIVLSNLISPFTYPEPPTI